MIRELPEGMMLLRFLVRGRPKGGSPEHLISAARSIAKSLGGEVRAPKITSHGSVEIDVFVSARADFELFLAALGPLCEVEFVHDLNVAPPHQSKEEMLAESVALFNAERYWEAHEVLETLWRNSSGQEKLLLQGLILVCAAFVHSQKGKPEVAIGVMRRASKQLEWAERTYHGIEIAHLNANVAAVLASGDLKEFTI